MSRRKKKRSGSRPVDPRRLHQLAWNGEENWRNRKVAVHEAISGTVSHVRLRQCRSTMTW